MIEKGLLKRAGGKSGKGGYACFEIQTEFIYLIKIQMDIELNSSGSKQPLIVNTPVVSSSFKHLPTDWENIDLSYLQNALKNIKSLNAQFFGKTQLKTIHSSLKNKLSVLEVQTSINSFAYGLMYHLEEAPYNQMTNPAAILFETLRNGDCWHEKRYLTQEESDLYKVYLSISKKVDGNIQAYYKKWKADATEQKYLFYKSKMRSNEFYDERVFEEKAFKDYKTNLWPSEKLKVILELADGLFTNDLLEKFDSIQKG